MRSGVMRSGETRSGETRAGHSHLVPIPRSSRILSVKLETGLTAGVAYCAGLGRAPRTGGLTGTDYPRRRIRNLMARSKPRRIGVAG
jgi:hypothetical protein